MTIRDDVNATLSVPFARRLEKNGKSSVTSGDSLSGIVIGTLDARLQRYEDKSPVRLYPYYDPANFATAITGWRPSSASGTIAISFQWGGTSSVQLIGAGSSTQRCYLAVYNNRIAGGLGLNNWTSIQGSTTLVEDGIYSASLSWDASSFTLTLNGSTEASGSWSGTISSDLARIAQSTGGSFRATASIWGISFDGGEYIYKCDEGSGLSFLNSGTAAGGDITVSGVTSDELWQGLQ